MIKPWLKIRNLEFKDCPDFRKRYGSIFSENPENTALIAVINHFEVMGHLVRRKMIDYEIIKLLPVSLTWGKVKPIVEGAREQLNEPRLYQMFEYLANEHQERKQRLQQTQQ